MRQFAAVLILIALFVLLVGTRFRPSDAERLTAVSRVAIEKVRGALPPSAALAAPVTALRRGIPQKIEDTVKARLEADTRLEGIAFDVSSEGQTVTLRGVVPTAKARRIAVSIAEHTTGVDKVIDELATPEN